MDGEEIAELDGDLQPLKMAGRSHEVSPGKTPSLVKAG